MARNLRGGFAATLTLIVVLAVALLVGILYVHFYVLPNITREIANTESHVVGGQSSSTASLSARVPPATGDSQSCAGNDLNCLISAATKCFKSDVQWTHSIDLLGIYNETAQVNLAVNGFTEGRCSFSERTDDLALSLTSAGEHEAVAEGLTDAEIQQSLQAVQAQASQQSVGTTIDCTLATSTLVKVLTNWSKGTFSAGDLASGNCTAILPNGSKAPLSTGESVQLTPSSQESSQPSANNSSGNSTAAAGPPPGVGAATVDLYADEDSTIDGVEFKVDSLTASELNVTITDHTTGESQTASLMPDEAAIVAGHDIEMTSIQQISDGTSNGEPIYTEQATLTYQ
jgi:hypothetical protein